MNSRTSARLACAFFLLTAAAGHAVAQSPPESSGERAGVTVARAVVSSQSALADSAPCIGDDDFHRFDGSPLPSASASETLPVLRVVIADPQLVGPSPRRAAERTRSTR